MNGDFGAVLDTIVGVEGWLSDDQARRLYERAAAVPAGGTIVEIGSCRGRSTIVLALAAHEGVHVVAIDPHAGNDRGPGEWDTSARQGDADCVAFEANLARAGVSGKVRHVRKRSSDALGDVQGPVALLYVDGAHGYAPARDDLVRWGARVTPGGTMLVHDSFSAVGVTLAILRELAFGGRFVYERRSRSLAEYRRARERLQPRARAENGVRQLEQLPWFARNLAIKLALAAKLDRLATALGHEAGEGLPY